MIKKILITFLILFILAQFFQIDKTNPPVQKPIEFATVNTTPNGVQKILKASCYDCHSFETNYPWYSYIVPLSYWMKNHIDEARHELNFSEWGTYDAKKKAKKIEECIEMITEFEMPPTYYTLMHSGSALNESESKTLIAYFKGLQTPTQTLSPDTEDYEHD